MVARIESATIAQQLSGVSTLDGMVAPLAAMIDRCEELAPESRGMLGDREEAAALRHLKHAAGYWRDSRALRGLK